MKFTDEELAELRAYQESHPAAARRAEQAPGLQSPGVQPASLEAVRPARGPRLFLSSLRLFLAGRMLVDSSGRRVPFKWW